MLCDKAVTNVYFLRLISVCAFTLFTFPVIFLFFFIGPLFFILFKD